MKKPVFHNRTRRSASIPRKLLKEGKWFLIPLYYILITSDLAREAFTHSGSYRFADHIYVSRPRGRFIIGRIIDFIFLSFPSAKSFRNRFIHTRDLVVLQAANYRKEKEIRILSVPAGIARTLHDAADILEAENPQVYRKAAFHCLDLDDALSGIQRTYLPRIARHKFYFHHGDALNESDYPRKFHIIVSTGLAEFLTDRELSRFYDICHKSLMPNGVLLTSASSRHRLSDYLMRNLGELHATYRTKRHSERLLAKSKFSKVLTYPDSRGYQTIIVAVR